MLCLRYLSMTLLAMFIVIIGINGVVVSSSEIACDERAQREFQECVNQLSEASKSQDFMFPHTESEIARVCGKIQEPVDCLNNFVNQCVPSSQREQVKAIYSGVESYVQDLCTPGSSYREEFLKHAPCLKTTEAEQQQCAAKYTQAAKDVSNETLSLEEKTERSCCIMNHMKNCFLTVVTSSCGKKTGDFLAQTYETISGPSIQLLCGNIKHDAPVCLQHLVTSFPPAESFAPAASFFTMPFFFLLSVIFIVVFIY